MARTGGWVALGVTVLLCAATGLWTLDTYSLPGSDHRANAWVAAIKNCPNDEGEAVADAEAEGLDRPVAGAQERCHAEGVRRVGAFGLSTVAVILPLIWLAVLRVRRQAAVVLPY